MSEGGQGMTFEAKTVRSPDGMDSAPVQHDELTE